MRALIGNGTLKLETCTLNAAPIGHCNFSLQFHFVAWGAKKRTL